MREKQNHKKESSLNAIQKNLKILVEINQAVSRNLNLRDSLQATLRILQQSYNLKTGAIFLVDDDGESLYMASSLGYRKDVAKTKYKFGEGLTGRIVETGKPIVVPRVSQEPLFLNRMSSFDQDNEKEQSFIGVPITLDYKTLGALDVSMSYNANRDYDTALNFLTLVASALLQPIRVQHVIQEERQKLLDENAALKHKLQDDYSFQNIIGNSNEMKDVLEQVAQVAQSNTTVLLRGESGTGKELVAEAVHYNSTRKDWPFIAVNCAAIPENLIESEFFGYEKGAFTGAERRKKGRFELADKGTIFLDEIGELSPMTQVKLLRVLQEQEFIRVGGTENVKINVRVITATNANLEELIGERKFREDLYYRLNVFSILLPPLRERRSDILLLADHFMLKYGRKHQKPVKRISTPAIDMLMSYHWPGNVRELENCLERAVLVCEDRVIHSYHLPPTLQTAESSNTPATLSLEQSVFSYEKELIEDTLKSTKGNKAQTARILNSTERIIGYKVKKYKIDLNRFKLQREP